MNRKIALYFSLAIIVIFILFIVYDSTRGRNEAIDQVVATLPEEEPVPMWSVESELEIPFGHLKSVAVSDRGIVTGGDSFIAFYTHDQKPVWNIETSGQVGALAISGDTIFACTTETVMLYDMEGRQLDEWGPYDDNSIITSVSANSTNVAIADAGNKTIYVLDRNGALVSIVGQPGNQFIIPSPYFDVSLRGGLIFAANTGQRRVETRNMKGETIDSFGESGTALEYFCACCNPSHFTFLPGGDIITAEKGINRIKRLKPDGQLVELVAQPPFFTPAIPVDVAADNNNLIYAANPADSKIYIFKRNL